VAVMLDLARPRPGRGLRIARLITVVGVLAVAAWAIAGALPGDAPRDILPGPTLVAGDGGNLRMWNSRDGTHILMAANLEPGGPRVRSVRIANTGRSAGRFSVVKRQFLSVPGPNGGRLRRTLRLRVTRAPSALGPRQVVYSGRLRNMPRLDLGVWEPQESRRYRFVVKLPDSGTPPTPTGGDNAYQGSQAQVRFVWQAVAP
jgi:hypothetical protein